MNRASTTAARIDPLGLACALLAAVGFSAKAIFVKLAYRYGVDAVTLLALRMLLSLPFFLALGWWAQRDSAARPLRRSEWLAVIVMGLLGYYLASLLDFLGLQYISAGLERLILFLYPTFVVLLSALLFGYRFTRRDGVALALSYAGIALAFLSDLSIGDGSGVAIGALLVLASALSYACYLIGSGQLVGKLGAMRYSAYASVFSCIAVLLQFACTRDWHQLLQPAPVLWLALAMALVSTVLPVLLLAEGIRRIGSSQAAMLGSVGPVVTIALGFFLLGEPITAVQMMGAALVVAGVLTISLKKPAQLTT